MNQCLDYLCIFHRREVNLTLTEDNYVPLQLQIVVWMQNKLYRRHDSKKPNSISVDCKHCVACFIYLFVSCMFLLMHGFRLLKMTNNSHSDSNYHEVIIFIGWLQGRWAHLYSVKGFLVLINILILLWS